MSLPKSLVFGASYILNRRIFNKRTPLIAGLTLTNRCNLRCRQCRIPSRKTGDLSYEEASHILDAFYREGGRTVYLQGGEPFLWHDRQHSTQDVVDYAHNKGFLAVVIYTNGTQPIQTSADTVFVSLNGLPPTHDYLRGKSFDLVMRNLEESRHPSLYVNFTINRYNQAEIEEFCRQVKEVDRIRGIFFYFHTPYYGYDDLYIGSAGRREILARLLSLKSKYKILNSRAGLRSALNNDWARPLDVCRIYEKDAIFECCRYPGDLELCRNCGYLSYAEIDQVLKLKPSAIFNAIKYF